MPNLSLLVSLLQLAVYKRSVKGRRSRWPHALLARWQRAQCQTSRGSGRGDYHAGVGRAAPSVLVCCVKVQGTSFGSFHHMGGICAQSSLSQLGSDRKRIAWILAEPRRVFGSHRRGQPVALAPGEEGLEVGGQDLEEWPAPRISPDVAPRQIFGRSCHAEHSTRADRTGCGRVMDNLRPGARGNHSFEGGICTPLIAHWPNGIQGAGGFVRTPAHLIDVMPTLVHSVADAATTTPGSTRPEASKD